MPAAYQYASGRLVWLDSLPGCARITEGEVNLFLAARDEQGHAGDRLFITVLRPGDALCPEAPVYRRGVAYVPAMVPCVDAQAIAAAPCREEWLGRIRTAITGPRQPEGEEKGEGQTVAALLASLIERRQAEKELRRERLAHNRVLTARAVTRKLDPLKEVCGVSDAGEDAAEDADPLERALRLIAGEYRLEVRDRDIAALRAASGKEPAERTRIFAQSANWRMRPVCLPPDCCKLSARPLLAFRKADGSPLVLYLRGSGSRYRDPVRGGEARALTLEVTKTLLPDAFCFYEPFPAKVNRKTLLRFVFATARPALAGMFSLGLVSACIGLVMPVATGYVTGKIIPTGNVHELWQLAFLLLALTACQISLGVVPSLVMMLFGAQQYERFQAAVFDRVLRIPVTAFQACDSGDMTQRILGASHVQSAVFSILSGQVIGSIFSLVSLAMMVWYSPLLAGVGAAVVVVYALSFFLLSRMNLGPLALQVAATGRMSGLLKQFFDGMAKIRGAGAEQQVISRFLDDFAPLSRNSFVIARNGAILQSVATVFPMLVTVLFFGLAGGLLDKNLPLPVFLAFMAAFQNFQGGLIGLSQGCWSLLAVEPEIRRFLPLLQAEPEDAGEQYPPGELDGSVTVSQLSFRYEPEGPLVLTDVSLEAKPGEFIAIVGPSGSGKSSLVRLLLGFERPESGGVFFSGKDLATLDKRAVRRQMGVILQSSKILPGSILENITTGTERGLDDAWRALRLAAFDEDVADMPMGIHTLVSPETISGGQQQRILIARALIGAPRIVIMDESTSALDNRAQEAVTANMEELRMTRLVIAHRLSTIARADRIYVLEKGRICQSGTYEELLALDGVFKRLVERQLMDAE